MHIKQQKSLLPGHNGMHWWRYKFRSHDHF